MARTALVTGTTGFLGAAIADNLASDGWTVIRTTRKIDGNLAPGWRFFDLSDSLPPDLLDDVDVVVHAGYVERKRASNSFAINVEGTRRLLFAARQRKARFVFISSLSATASARSQYGRQKFAIEGLLDLKRDLVVRPGLIIGQGGIFDRFLRHVRSRRPIPLIDGGDQPLQTIYIVDLIRLMRVLISSGATGIVVLAETPAVPYRVFFQALASHAGLNARFLPIPSRLLLSFADVAVALKLPSPIDRDNVLGLLDMKYVPPSSAGSWRLPHVRRFDESLAAVLSAPASAGNEGCAR